jgi:murein DD-endopeptidase MepM/ murein hydrolase activator NlpD
MKRILVLVAAGALLAATGAAAGNYGLPAGMPSADTPNASGSIVVPAGWTSGASHSYTLTPDQLQQLWQAAGNAYGIQWQVLAAINKIESNFGRNMGPSSAGAIGWMQFMPSTWLRWGVDADNDGIADPWDPYDAVYAAARYLAATGGQTDIRGAIYSYNHADWYVREVLQVASLYGNGGEELTFSLDRVQVDLAAAARDVTVANGKLVKARHTLAILERKAAKIRDRARHALMLSDRAEGAKAAAIAQGRADAQAVTVDALQQNLQTARQNLVAARDAVTQAAAQSASASTLLGAPSSGGGYVFPVGGGPATVSAAHTHHDYPAVDIAAPSGAPEYALEAGTVVNAWSGVDARCGIGFTFKGVDGQTWTYCHQSYRDPSVVDGADLTAGQPVGLVGMTGDASGPHLHLQLQPANAWPQQEAWFVNFAGTAFRWQDAPTPGFDSAVDDGTGNGEAPVFSVQDSSSDNTFAVVPDPATAPATTTPEVTTPARRPGTVIRTGPFGVLN